MISPRVRRVVAASLILAAALALPGERSLAALQSSRTLDGAIIATDRAHVGRFGRHDYTVVAFAGQLAVLFAPLPLVNEPGTLHAAAAHLVRFAFGDTIDDVTSERRDVGGVVTLAFPAAARTYVVTPVRNGRNLVHALLIHAEPADRRHASPPPF